MARSVLMLSLCCAFLVIGDCRAQGSYRYRAVLAMAHGTSTPKGLHACLQRIAGDGKWEFTESTGVLELKLRAAMTAAELQTQLHELGMAVTLFEPLASSLAAPITPRRRLPAHPDFPVFLDTGDRILDGQRYEREKSTWIATHPEAYLEMTAPVPVTHTQQAE